MSDADEIDIDEVEIDPEDIIEHENTSESEDGDGDGDSVDDDPSGSGTQESTRIWTIPIVTKFEEARLIGERAQMIAGGMPPLIPCANMTPLEIAREEYRQNKLPLIIRRKIPTRPKGADGQFIYQLVRPRDLIH